MKAFVFLLLLSTSFFSEAKNCFSDVCAKMTKEDLKALGFKKQLMPFSFAKSKNMGGLVIDESAYTRNNLICSYSKIIPRNKKGLKLLLSDLKVNKVETDQLGEKIKEKEFDEQIRYKKGDRAYSLLKIKASRDTYSFVVYFGSHCEPKHTIFQCWK